MVTRRRKKKKSCVLPAQDLSYCRDSILYRPGPGSYDPLRRLLPLALSRPPPSCKLPFFFLAFLLAVVCSYLATLSCKPHPVCTAAGQTLSLRDAKDISQAIAFSAWVRYLYNWVLPAAEVLRRNNESEKEKRESDEEEPKQGSGSISTRNPLKYVWEAPTWTLSYSPVQWRSEWG